MADERRPGDWLHRDLRANANNLATETKVKNEASRSAKWYDQPFWIILLLVVFWPVGIVLVWRSKWLLPVKIALSAALVLVIIASWALQQATAQL